MSRRFAPLAVLIVVLLVPTFGLAGCAGLAQPAPRTASPGYPANPLAGGGG